ncbi:MAG: phosphate acyltransferase PlsX [Christensenellales bacterium]|jgi:glycerol-3-phosphate acyltransferase PlsX
MKIAVDVFGGDHAPDAILQGCVDALNAESGFDLILFGDESRISNGLKDFSFDNSRVRVCHAPEVVEMHDSPTGAIKEKPQSSLVMGLRAVEQKEADVFVSAGSTGAVMAGATLIVRRIRGIKRPALAPVLPTEKGGVLLIDCGANVDCKPVFLQQFGMMGSIYMNKVFGVDKPRVALINNGAEEGKGSALAQASYALLKEIPINFVGNVEGRDILSGDFDVVVADGFVGNVILKFMEGMAGSLFSVMKREFMTDTRSKLGAMLLGPAFRRLKKNMDYSEYGGALFLGIDGGIVKAHGSSNAKAIASTIRQAKRFSQMGVVEQIKQEISALDTL